MGFFSFLFGTGSANTSLSQKEHYLTKLEIQQLVSRVKVNTLSNGEESLVEETIDTRRRGDGKISLYQIYEALRKLQNLNKISKFDRQGLMRVFGEFFTRKFGE